MCSLHSVHGFLAPARRAGPNVRAGVYRSARTGGTRAAIFNGLETWKVFPGVRMAAAAKRLLVYDCVYRRADHHGGRRRAAVVVIMLKSVLCE